MSTIIVITPSDQNVPKEIRTTLRLIYEDYAGQGDGNYFFIGPFSNPDKAVAYSESVLGAEGTITELITPSDLK